MQNFKMFLVVLVSFIFLDYIWVANVMKNFYSQNIPGMKIYWPAVLPVYILMAIGLVYFVLPKTSGANFQTFLTAGAFGLILYGVYDFTNLSTLPAWTLKLSIVDMVWGGVICGIAAVVANWLK